MKSFNFKQIQKKLTLQSYSKHIWLRHEVKKGEKRSPLTPTGCKELLNEGFKITVEKSLPRIFDDNEFKKVGCTLVESQTWVNAPEDAFILGLKELPTEKQPGIPLELKHRHIMFGHVFKHQKGWQHNLNRFKLGKGELLDLEFLTFDDKNRVAAFGKSAGYAGMATGFLVWIHQHLKGLNVPFPALEAYQSKQLLVDEIKQGLAQISKKPKTTIIGSRGRCGQGALELLSQIQLDSINWNSKETSVGGPFISLANCDILLNAIYLSDSNPKQLFLDEETILKAEQEKTRNLSVFVDVSCDCGNPKNPFPISEVSTTFDFPVNRLSIGSSPLDVIAIDHLPTLIPRESSEEYSKALLPHLKTLKEMNFDSVNQNSTEMIRVWQRARDLYYQKSKDL